MDSTKEVKGTMCADDETVTSGSRTAGNGQEEEEFLVRFQLPPRPNVTQAKQVMSVVLLSILKTYTNDISYIDNKQEELVYEVPGNDENYRNLLQNSAMTAHQVPSKKPTQNGSRWIFVLKFRSTISYRDWKKQEQILVALKSNKVFMTQHQFPQNEWEIIGLGFLLGIHVVQFPQDAAKAHIEKLIQHSDPDYPAFALIPSKVQIKGKPTYTRAYEISCHKKDGPKLYYLLTHGKFRESNHRVFIPYSLKRTNEKTFTALLKENNQMLSDSYVMKFQGIPKDGMPYLEPKLKDVPGVRFVVPTSKMQSHGEWRILIKASKFHGVNGYIRQHWDEWCRDIPQECYDDVPMEFPAPTITSRNTKYVGAQDDDSAESYGTLLSAASTLTVETAEGIEDLDSCPLDATMPTYAQVLVTNNLTPSPASTITQSIQLPNPISALQNGTNESSLNTWEEENRHLHQKIIEQEQRIQALDKAKTELDERVEKILEEVQTKECRTKELEDAIARLLTIVSDRDQQMAERDHQFEIRNRQFDALMERLELNVTNPSDIATGSRAPETPARSNKRQNTHQTPNRDQGKTPPTALVEDSSMDTIMPDDFNDDTGQIVKC